jgi:hypothetical protein
MIGLLVALFLGALVVEIIRKSILRMKDPSLEEVWVELDQQNWYQELIQDDIYRKYLEQSKQEGLLSDWYYVRKVVKHKGARDGFIEYVNKEIHKEQKDQT